MRTLSALFALGLCLGTTHALTADPTRPDPGFPTVEPTRQIWPTPEPTRPTLTSAPAHIIVNHHVIIVPLLPTTLPPTRPEPQNWWTLDPTRWEDDPANAPLTAAPVLGADTDRDLPVFWTSEPTRPIQWAPMAPLTPEPTHIGPYVERTHTERTTTHTVFVPVLVPATPDPTRPTDPPTPVPVPWTNWPTREEPPTMAPQPHTIIVPYLIHAPTQVPSQVWMPIPPPIYLPAPVLPSPVSAMPSFERRPTMPPTTSPPSNLVMPGWRRIEGASPNAACLCGPEQALCAMQCGHATSNCVGVRHDSRSVVDCAYRCADAAECVAFEFVADADQPSQGARCYLLRERPRSAISEGYASAHCYLRNVKPSSADATPTPSVATDAPVAAASLDGSTTMQPTAPPTMAPTGSATVMMKFHGNVEDFESWQLGRLKSAVINFIDDPRHSVETSLLASSVVCQITIRGPDALHLARNLEYAILAGLFDPLKPQFPVELHHDTASDDTASDDSASNDADDAASTLPTMWTFSAWSDCDGSKMSGITYSATNSVCGKRMQTRVVQCYVAKGNGMMTTTNLCDPQAKPVAERQCWEGCIEQQKEEDDDGGSGLTIALIIAGVVLLLLLAAAAWCMSKKIRCEKIPEKKPADTELVAIPVADVAQFEAERRISDPGPATLANNTPLNDTNSLASTIDEAAYAVDELEMKRSPSTSSDKGKTSKTSQLRLKYDAADGAAQSEDAPAAAQFVEQWERTASTAPGGVDPTGEYPTAPPPRRSRMAAGGPGGTQVTTETYTSVQRQVQIQGADWIPQAGSKSGIWT